MTSERKRFKANERKKKDVDTSRDRNRRSASLQGASRKGKVGIRLGVKVPMAFILILHPYPCSPFDVAIIAIRSRRYQAFRSAETDA
jgi:hypothetical protein